MRFCSAMPMLKKRSGKASRNGRMSVYLARSALRPTILACWCAISTRASPNGTSTVGRPAPVASFCPIARVRTASTMGGLRVPIEFRPQRVPFAGLDPHEMGLLAPFERRHAAAGTGAQHDRMRPALGCAGLSEGGDDCGEVIAVDLLRGPAERAPLGGDGFYVEHQSAVGLNAVAVDQRDEIVQPEMRGRHGGLPVRPFLPLAVGKFDEDSGGRMPEPQTKRHADPLTESMAERAAGHLNAGRGVERRHV